MSHLKTIVRPASELHLAVLVVEGEPCDVDGAGGEEDAGGDVGAEAVRGDHHVGWVGSVKSLAGTEDISSFWWILLFLTCCTSECRVSTVVLEEPATIIVVMLLST